MWAWFSGVRGAGTGFNVPPTWLWERVAVTIPTPSTGSMAGSFLLLPDVQDRHMTPVPSGEGAAAFQLAPVPLCPSFWWQVAGGTLAPLWRCWGLTTHSKLGWGPSGVAIRKETSQAPARQQVTRYRFKAGQRGLLTSMLLTGGASDSPVYHPPPVIEAAAARSSGGAGAGPVSQAPRPS